MVPEIESHSTRYIIQDTYDTVSGGETSIGHMEADALAIYDLP
jgi:hypothetical protein